MKCVRNKLQDRLLLVYQILQPHLILVVLTNGDLEILAPHDRYTPESRYFVEKVSSTVISYR